MTTGRTLKRWTRVYIDGYDFSGYTREVGPLSIVSPEVEQVGLSDSVRGALPDLPEVSMGTLNAIFSSDTGACVQAVLGAPGVSRKVMIPIGIQAAPAQGDPVFMGAFNHNGFILSPSGGDMALTVPFGRTSPAEQMTYSNPWGVLLHASGEETSANTAVGIDDRGAASSLGGWMMYQVFSADGTGTLVVSIQDAATNSDASFADLLGATSGNIADSAVPCAGIVKLATNATVKRYLRWQLSLTGITSATFALSFVRG